MLEKFDPKIAPKESDLIRFFFQDGLQSSIKAEMENPEGEYEN